jgi:hypothetical protein
MKELSPYFDLFKNKPGLVSEMKAARPAVEVLIFDKHLVAQQRLWDTDELIIPSKSLFRRESPDLGEYDSSGNSY